MADPNGPVEALVASANDRLQRPSSGDEAWAGQALKAAWASARAGESHAAQLIAAHVLTFRSLTARGVQGAHAFRLTGAPPRMLLASDKDRGPSFIDRATVEAVAGPAAAHEGQPGPYWRGWEGVPKLAGSLVEGPGPDGLGVVTGAARWRDASPRLVLYTMLHGFVRAPEPLRVVTGESVSTWHDTAFLHDELPGSRQAVSTGLGHAQGAQLDIKQIVAGEGLQLLIRCDADAQPAVVLAQRLLPGGLVLAPPGHVDAVVNLGGLRFSDVSVRVPETLRAAFHPGAPAVPAAAPLAVLRDGPQWRVWRRAAIPVQWLSAPAPDLLGGTALLDWYRQLAPERLERTIEQAAECWRAQQHHEGPGLPAFDRTGD